MQRGLSWSRPPPALPPPPRFSFPLQPCSGSEASLLVSSRGAAIQPQGCHAFSTRVMPSHLTQPLSPWSPLALVLVKHDWVASGIFQKVLPILPSRYHLYTTALSPTSPPLLCSSFLKTAIGRRAPGTRTHLLGRLPSCSTTGAQTALCVTAQSNVHLGSFQALWRHLFLPEIHAMGSCVSCC